jgi:hypothetical protein
MFLNAINHTILSHFLNFLNQLEIVEAAIEIRFSIRFFDVLKDKKLGDG